MLHSVQIKGRLEGGQLYTPAYVARVTAMVCGAARGITVPTNLSTVWTSLQQLLLDMDGASGVSVEAAFFQSLFNGLMKEGEILGSLRAGVHWTPAVWDYLISYLAVFGCAQCHNWFACSAEWMIMCFDVFGRCGIGNHNTYCTFFFPKFPLCWCSVLIMTWVRKGWILDTVVSLFHSVLNALQKWIITSTEIFRFRAIWVNQIACKWNFLHLNTFYFLIILFFPSRCVGICPSSEGKGGFFLLTGEAYALIYL